MGQAILANSSDITNMRPLDSAYHKVPIKV